MELHSNFGNPAKAVAGQNAEAQKALLAIRQARDSVLAQNHELISKLSWAQEQLAVSSSEREALECERDVALKRAEKYMVECEELRRRTAELTEDKLSRAQADTDHTTTLVQQIAVISDDREALRARCDDQNRMIDDLRVKLASAQNPEGGEKLAVAVEEARRRVLDLEAQAEGFKAQQKKNIVSLTKHLTGDRELMKERHAEEAAALKAQIAELQAQLEQAANNGAHAVGAGLAEREERHVLELEELAAQLEATRIENRELRSALDATRAPVETEKIKAPVLPEAGEALTYDASVALGAMSSCLEMLSQHPSSVELLDELDGHLRGFSERAGSAGFAAIHRYGATCGDLTAWLLKTPSKISPATLAPLGEAIELLGRLAGSRDSARLFDPAEALVYAVDDDLDNCECIAMALEKVELRTKYAVRPEVALAELIASPCDLIVLDVDMPRMDGFELASRLRQVEHHATTPIIFLSGLISTRDRLEASQISGATYMAKPYNLKELGLKVLGLILSSRAELA